MILAIGDDGQFTRFCAIAGHPEWSTDARFSSNVQRVAHRAELIHMLRQTTILRSTFATARAGPAHERSAKRRRIAIITACGSLVILARKNDVLLAASTGRRMRNSLRARRKRGIGFRRAVSLALQLKLGLRWFCMDECRHGCRWACAAANAVASDATDQCTGQRTSATCCGGARFASCHRNIAGVMPPVQRRALRQ